MMPSSLPKLLNAVKWSQHKDVAVVSHHVCFSTYVYIELYVFFVIANAYTQKGFTVLAVWNIVYI